MIKIIVIIAVIAVGAFVIASMSSQPPLRGLVKDTDGQSVLLSRARPAATFSLDKRLRLAEAGWCDVHPETRTNVDGDAKLWMAVYTHEKGLVITAVADSIDRWVWEAGDHAAYKPVRAQKRPGDPFSIFETITVLDHSHDPFCCQAKAARSTKEPGACLVYRARMIVEFDKTQIIVEYHEDLPENIALDIAYEDAYLNEFSRRARAAVQPVLLSKEDGKALAEGIEKPGTITQDISRRSLAVWTGKMYRKGHND